MAKTRKSKKVKPINIELPPEPTLFDPLIEPPELDPTYVDVLDELPPADLDQVEWVPPASFGVPDVDLFHDDRPPETKMEMKTHHPSELEKTDLTELFSMNGPMATELEDYEVRDSQIQMAEAIKRALIAEKHALIEAPTGTGKSIAYLIPAILAGKTVVVATANKSLQSQLYRQDIPFLRKVLKKPISAVVVKGRSNFLCSYKWDKESFEQQSFAFQDKEHDQVTFLRTWLDETKTGDVDDLPFVLDSELRPRLVSFSDDCLQSDCTHFADNCWINKMRDKATEAQILITNHHLLLNALELGWAGERILPPAAVYVIDEAHQLEQTATNVFEATVTDYTVRQLLTRGAIKDNVNAERIDDLEMKNLFAFQEVERMSDDSAFRIENDLDGIKELAQSLSQMGEVMKRDNPYADETGDAKQEPRKKKPDKSEPDEGDEKRRMYEQALAAITSAVNKLMAVAVSKRDENFVRYAVRVRDRRHVSLELHAAPIDPALLLQQFLFHPEASEGYDEPVERTVVCTSATLSTKNNFDHFKIRCGVLNAAEEMVLPAVFDYPQQALLYQPNLPSFNYRAPEPYYEAVANEIGRLLEASRGRALCLFTSWKALDEVRKRLMEADNPPIWPMRSQGDTARDALLAWFKATPHSVMLATRSFWEGVDIPGDDLSLVVLDKMPFPTPSDPLHSARMKVIDEEREGKSFGEYMLPLMTLALKQGFGRLVRRSSDNGVVAILDERLTSKGYGRQARNDLPPARFSRDFGEVHQFYRRVTESEADFALNVWSPRFAPTEPDAKADAKKESMARKDAAPQWRWQLSRLQDGKSDGDAGVDATLKDAVEGEIHAAIFGLQNLAKRIEVAKRETKKFGVELRCSLATADALTEGKLSASLIGSWRAEQARWRLLHIIGVVTDS